MRPHRAPRPGRASQVVSFDRLIDGLWATTCPPMPLSLTAAALSALQTFLRYPELAQKHHSAPHAYGALRRKLEHAMTFTPAEIDRTMAEIRQPWDDADSACPALPGRIYEKAGRDTHKHPKKQMAGPPMEYDDPDWKFAPTDNELPLQTAEQEREWLHHLQTALQEIVPAKKWNITRRPLPLPMAPPIQGAEHRVEGSTLRSRLWITPPPCQFYIVGDGSKDENQITPWQQAVALVLKRVGNVQIDYEWAAVIGPRPTIWAHVKGLASPASVAHLNLAPMELTGMVDTPGLQPRRRPRDRAAAAQDGQATPRHPAPC